ncbi:MAG: toll/interleukin-1 receptor domain-containing protein [Gemmataceae bacterium]
MPISVSCACGRQFRAKDHLAGKTVKCPKCEKNLVIAGPSVAGFDVFLSYSSKDKAIADAACAALEARDLRCWVAPRDIIPGNEWGAAIIEGIEQSQSMVLVFSDNANTSQQVMREVERAVHRGMPIIPFRIEDVPASKNMEYFISCHHWMDAFDGSMEEHLDQLARTVRSLLAGKDAASQSSKLPRQAAPPRSAPLVQDSPSPRSAVSRVLLILVGILLVGGGAAGFYVWKNRNPSKDDEALEKERQFAQTGSQSSNDKERETEKDPKTQNSSPSNSDQKELIAKGKRIPRDKSAKQSGDGKNPQSPVEEPKQVKDE